MANPARGWQAGLSVLECMKYRLENQVDCDVTFVFPYSRNQKVLAHKYMLASRSQVFEAMFSGNFRDDTQDVEIVDSDPNTFKEMLRYIYTDQPSMASQNVILLLQVAKKYMLDGLHSKCVAFLKANINKLTVCTILNDSLANHEEHIAEKCVKYIGKIVDKVITTEAFLGLCEEALLAIVQSDELRISSEMRLFEACLKWATHNSSHEYVGGDEMRQQLGECLKQIRLWNIPPEDFANILAKVPGLLTPEETTHIYGYMLSKNDFNKETLLQMNFNLTPRKQPFMRLARFQDNMIKYGLNASQQEILTFQVNNDAKLFGFGLFGGKEGDVIKVDLTLRGGKVGLNPGAFQFGGAQNELLTKYDRQITSAGCPVMEILFESPISIGANVRYSLTVSMTGNPRYYGTNGKRQIESPDCLIHINQVENVAHFDNATTVTRTGNNQKCQIAEMFISAR